MSQHWTEYYEGMKAFDRASRLEEKLPYNMNGMDRGRALQWLEGWEAAKRENDDGGGRQNA